MMAVVPYKAQLPVHIPDEMWYRFEDRRYSIADEYGDHSHTRMAIELRKYWVHHHTPKGVWLTMFRPNGRPLKEFYAHFVLKGATKKFACPTIELAKESFIARKRKQARIHRARADAADQAVQMIEAQKEWR